MTDEEFKEKLIKVLSQICEELIRIEEAIKDVKTSNRKDR